jgi:thiamine biosynthesis protein ThiC
VEVLSWPNGVCFTTKKNFSTPILKMRNHETVRCGFFLEMVYAGSIADANDAAQFAELET